MNIKHCGTFESSAKPEAPVAGTSPKEFPSPATMNAFPGGNKTAVLCAAFLLFWGQVTAAENAPAAGAPPTGPAAPVLSPEEELRTFQLPPGFRIEIVAADPLVHDPAAAAYDLEGNLWVAEFSTFNAEMIHDLPALAKDVDPAVLPKCKIIKLESSHHDGRFDRRVVWLDGLEMARGIAIVHNGILVSDTPNLWLARDAHGTGRCDEKILLVNNYAVPGYYSEYSQLLPVPYSEKTDEQKWAFQPPPGKVGRRYISPEHSGSLLWGRDNIIHDVDFSFDYRYHDRSAEPLAVPARGQFGITQDDFGRLFFNSNSDHLRCDLFAPAYGVRNPNVTDIPWTNVRVAADQQVWPRHPTPAVTGGYRRAAAGSRNGGLDGQGMLLEFTAACSPLIYRGVNFPPSFYGNAFIAEPAGNLIKRDLLLEAEGQITAVNAYRDREFLTSTDPRFRPVALVNAPDGSLIVVDMYRGVLEDYHDITTYLQKKTVSLGLHQPMFGGGRIFKIVYEDRPLETTQPNLLQQSAVELAALLGKPNGWWRDTAQQEMVERGDLGAVPALNDLALHAPNEAARVAALWTLDGLRASTPALLLHALADVSPKVRAAAVRLHERWLAGDRAVEMVRQLSAALCDPQPEVSVQLALTLGEAKAPIALDAMQELLLTAGDHPFLPTAIATGLKGREHIFLERLAASLARVADRPELQTMLTILSTAILRQGEHAQIAALIQRASDSGGMPAWARRAVLRGFEVLQRRDFQRVFGINRVIKPEEWAPLTGSSDSEIKALSTRLVNGLARQAEAASRRAANATPLREEDRKLYEQGRVIFQLCAACHQTAGTGQPNLAPSLVDSPWTIGSPEILARIILNGKEGTRGFPAPMPPVAGTFSDGQVVSVLTYIRNSWGLHEGPVAAELIAKVRKELGGRQAPWTDAELNVVAKLLDPTTH